MLATNPVDLDYKGLSNAGTWFIGRLQTERDKLRLLEGLQAIEAGVDRGSYDKLISALRPRVFLMHNVHHHGGAQTFQTRWCLNYLAGPLTRAQLGGLKPLGSGLEGTTASFPADVLPVPAVQPAPAVLADSRPPMPARAPVAQPASDDSSPLEPADDYAARTRTPPALPAGASAGFLAPELSLSQALARTGASFAGPARPEGVLYRPALLQAEVPFTTGAITWMKSALRALVARRRPRPGGRNARAAARPARLDSQPLADARFVSLPEWLSSARNLSAVQKDFSDWVFRTASLRLFANETLKVFSSPDDSQASFRQRCDEVARAGWKAEAAKLTAAFEAKLTAIENRVIRQEMKVKKNEDEVNQRRMEEFTTGAEVVLSIFSKRKRSLSTAQSKRRMTSQANADLEAAERTLDALEDEYNSLKKQRDEAVRQAQERWARRGRSARSPSRHAQGYT
jgi:hypothetical protein